MVAGEHAVKDLLACSTPFTSAFSVPLPVLEPVLHTVTLLPELLLIINGPVTVHLINRNQDTYQLRKDGILSSGQFRHLNI